MFTFQKVGLLCAAAVFSLSSATAQQWTPERAWQWYRSQPLPIGVNYISANSVSYTEMWMDYGFDPRLIDHELSLAQGTGFNCVRVVLSFTVWQGEPKAFRDRFEAFLTICEKRGLKVIPAFFDDCAFGPLTDPVFGKQPDEVVGWEANAWSPSPGHKLVRDPKARHDLERYVKDIMTAHLSDPRISIWDLYNEPSNSGMGDDSLPLLRDVFAWARQVSPLAPVTSAPWDGGTAKVSEFQAANSDIITFHSYAPPLKLLQRIEELKRLGRPMICSEWMNRDTGSTVAACLPLFLAERVGCVSWGLVNGRDQTQLPWDHRPGDPPPKIWMCDLFRPDFSPYDPVELTEFVQAIQLAAKLH